MKDCCLIVIFNHRYDKNIYKIKDIYAGRFSDIYIVMPFYSEKQVEGIHIIPVYESSWKFQGYISQAYLHIKKNYKHYVVIADDLILNPNLNESNIIEYLNLGEHDSYIKGLTPICESKEVTGIRLYRDVLIPFIQKNGTEWEGMIADRKEAIKILASKNIKYDVSINISWLIKDICGEKSVIMPIRIIWRLMWTIGSLIRNKGLRLPYPLFKEYSDFHVINGNDMDSLCNMLGVFAAMGLFVEVALPTAMAICCKSVVCESDIKKHGIEFWQDSEKNDFAKKHASSLSKLFEGWEKDVIYYHPVKLSEWKA